MKIEDITTKDLVSELVKREGVKEFVAVVDQDYLVDVRGTTEGSYGFVQGTGPARILVVID